ncbi:MAG: hypothetical protein QME60_07220 [Verrucomicrobiota bacterium]|nr:hypothetical protein [Verrucomicrobiota bacterium]
MADIEIKCPVCEVTITVSEFADPDSLYCRSCGGKVQKPAATPAAKKKKPVVHKPDIHYEQSVPNKESERGQTSEWLFHERVRKKQQAEKPRKIFVGPAVRSWAIFTALAAIMFTARYRNVLSHRHLDYLVTYGPIAIAAFHIMAALKAFKDSVFHGVLCVIFPPYSLYYVFLISDDFYMRAVYGSLIVGAGCDTFIFAKKYVILAYFAIKHWIEYGALH